MNQRELDKNAARRLAIIRHAQEVTGNVAMTCRYYGISTSGVWRILRRVDLSRRQVAHDHLRRR